VQNNDSDYAIPTLSTNDQFDWPLADFSLEGNASSEEFVSCFPQCVSELRSRLPFFRVVQWNSMMALMEDTLF
jgi:hypothetical protein